MLCIFICYSKELEFILKTKFHCEGDGVNEALNCLRDGIISNEVVHKARYVK